MGFLSKEIRGIRLVDYSWFTILLIGWKIITTAPKFWKYVITVLFNFFKLKNNLQWKLNWNHNKNILKILSVLDDLDIKIITFLIKNRTKTLFDFANENNYFHASSGANFHHIFLVKNNFYKDDMFQTNIVLNEILDAFERFSKEEKYTPGYVQMFERNLITNKINKYGGMYMNLISELEAYTKEIVLDQNIEIQKCFQKLKNSDLLLRTDIYSATVTTKFSDIFK
jgi:hypothetical protein